MLTANFERVQAEERDDDDDAAAAAGHGQAAVFAITWTIVLLVIISLAGTFVMRRVGSYVHCTLYD